MLWFEMYLYLAGAVRYSFHERMQVQENGARGLERHTARQRLVLEALA